MYALHVTHRHTPHRTNEPPHVKYHRYQDRQDRFDHITYLSMKESKRVYKL